jgi:molecular chaperone DnaK (HSP70)
MRLGIDFGTTRVVVAQVDRGNFPLVSFEAPDGQTHDWFPPVAAVNGDARLYGWHAIAAQEDENWTVLRSLKRYLRSANPHTQVPVAGQLLPLRLLMTEMMMALRIDLIQHSNLAGPNFAAESTPGDPNKEEPRIEIMLGVPASANSNQRFLTEEAAQQAGFTVLGLLNEPSAAAIEFAHRNSADRKSRIGSGLVVYDLGGGTFDVSLVTMGEAEHTVEASSGISTLGGDDFDEILAALAVESISASLGEQVKLSPSERYRLLEECREKKESLNANTRKITLDMERVRAAWEQVTIPVDDFYERCRPLIEQTRDVVEELLAAHSARPLDTLYVTGGAAELPPVARILRETFGRKVRRSAYMRSASAIGLAIRGAAPADTLSGSLPDQVNDQFNRNLGIWREADHGGTIFFDLIFPRGVQLPSPEESPLLVERVYEPAHNIGHFRYLEASQLDKQGQPTGEIANWDQILFPFDPELQRHPSLASVPVAPLSQPNAPKIREQYTCDSAGNLRVRISAEPGGYARDYSISQSA